MRRRLARYRINRIAVKSFSVVDLEKRKIISGYRRLKTDTTINVNRLPAAKISILAHTYPRRVGSVIFKLDTIEKLRNESPYLLLDPRDSGDRYWKPAPGSYTLSAVPFSLKNGGGIAGKKLQIELKFVSKDSESTPVPTPQPTASSTATPLPSTSATLPA